MKRMSKVYILNQEQETDYACLTGWCMTIFDFYLSLFPGQTTQLIVDLFKQSIANIDKEKDIKKMRALYRETNKMFRADIFGKEAMDQLNQLLRKKYNNSISDEIDKESEAIQKIIKRRKIRNDCEFELVKRREEEIWQDDSQIEYAETLRHLMEDYEN